MAASQPALNGLEWLTRMRQSFSSVDTVVTPDDAPQYDDRKETTISPTAESVITDTMTTDFPEIQPPMKISRKLESTLSEIPWTRTLAAGSFVVGALLLISGRRKTALAVSAAGAAVALLENPEIVREAWNAMPRLVRTGQDFLVRVEDFVEELNKQGQHLRKVMVGE